MTNTPVQALDLDAIKARVQAATKGPWRVALGEMCHRKGSPICVERCRGKGEVPIRIEQIPAQPPKWTETEAHVLPNDYADDVIGADDTHVVCCHERDSGYVLRADAEFIAHARTDMPSLISALEASQAEVERLRATVAAVTLKVLKWKAEGDKIDLFHATMGTGYHACAKQLDAALQERTQP